MTIALNDVVAVVTGAAGGIGRELVKALKAANATVIATDLAPDAQIEGADHYLKHDVTSEADWQAVAALVQEKYGRLDALVNNAGYSIVTKFDETPLSDFHRVNAINVDSIIIGTQTMMPLLRAGGKARKGGASVVNFSSVGGLRGAAFNAAYCTSKAAVKMLSKCLGAEFAALDTTSASTRSIRAGSIRRCSVRSWTSMSNSALPPRARLRRRRWRRATRLAAWVGQRKWAAAWSISARMQPAS